MTVDDAVAAVKRLRPVVGSLLPFYALLTATGDVVRLPLILAAVGIYVVLSTTGRLGPVVDDLAAVNPERLAPEGPAGVAPAVSGRLGRTLATPEVLGPALVGLVVAAVAFVLARGVTQAAALSAIEAGLDSRDPLESGVSGIARWRTFAGLVLVRWGLLMGAGLPLVAAGAGVLGTLSAPEATLTAEAAAALLTALVGVAITVTVGTLVLALLAFAGPAAVVDRVGLRTAIRRSVGVPFAHPGGFVLYAVVAVAATLLGAVGTGVFSVAGVARLGALVSAFLVAPLLDAFAVALYREWAADRSETVDRTVADDETGFVFGEQIATTADQEGEQRPVATAVSDGLRDGIRTLGEFCRRDWGYVVAAGGVLAGSTAAGWSATVGYGVRITAPSDPGMVFGAVPVGPFVNIAVNNWLVATGAGFSGLFAGAPSVGTLLFNGLLVGAVAGVVDPLTFLALVGPHGIVELPAIAVAGGVGLRLGHVSWRAWRGKTTDRTLADELGRTWRVVVGLLPVFVVASFIEAFVTPQVATAVL